MKHFIFDTETTGLIKNSLMPLAKQPKVIELFAMVVDDEQDWAEVTTLHSYFDPKQPLPAIVTKITGITDAMVKGQPAFSSMWEPLEMALGISDAVVAHNLSYDIAMINFECKRIGVDVLWPQQRICTVECTESIRGHRLSLTKLHQELFGEAFENAHSAEKDVRALARCYIELHKRDMI